MKPKNFVRSEDFDLYQEIESFPELSQSDEKILIEAIDTALKNILRVLTQVPESLEIIQSHFAQITQGKLTLESLLHGFRTEKPARIKLDLAEVQQRLFKLSLLQYEAQGALQHFGPRSLKTKEIQGRLLEALSGIQWTGQILDQLVHYVQSLVPKQNPIGSLQQQLNSAFTVFKQAQEAMVAANLRLVMSIARRYSRNGLPFLDLFQEGSLGLSQAVEQFDARWNIAFSSYATPWIKQAVLRAILKHNPSCSPIEETRLEDIEDLETTEPLAAVSAQELSRLTEKALSMLSPEEAKILRLRFGIGTASSYSVKEMEQQFKISADQIRQIEVKALNALRDQMDLPQLKTFLDRG